MKGIILWVVCLLANGGMLLHLILEKYSFFSPESLVSFFGIIIPCWVACWFYVFTTLGSGLFLIDSIKKKVG